MILIFLCLQQTEDLRCSARLLNEKFEKMSETKKAIIRELEFGGLMHIMLMNMPHKLLKELANSFNLDKNKSDTRHGSLKIKPKKIGAVVGINASRNKFSEKVSFKELSEENKEIFRRFEGKTLKNLTNQIMDIGVDNYQDRLRFKRIFILYIQMAFLLPTTINKVSPVHLAPIFRMDNIMECNWDNHVLNFIIKGITNYRLKKKKSIDACLYALMIVYFHLTKHKDKKEEVIPGLPWVSDWNRELLIVRIRAEIDGHMITDEQNTFSNLGVFYLCRWCKLTFRLFQGIIKRTKVKKKLKEMKET
ncbi:hypothetical protein Ahy_A03g010202 [Arachis hypogaea]|uniref:DUF1985 domain-containing protein n=1 Tax=Arachis hypogaea TaxID=3818 RepID=A0A445DLE8_ARAHY|nr:hypothetical protein Ahy_A03g010202 [Arachis hypogaea]